MPKQFHCIEGDESFFSQALERAWKIPMAGAPVIVCNSAHIKIAQAQIPKSKRSDVEFILEPCARNTAPAIAAAAFTAISNHENSLILIMAADQVIENNDGFRLALELAAPIAEMDKLVAFGVVPQRPETGYGYIMKGSDHSGWFDVAGFIEKPDAETARSYFQSGRFLWNSGIFLFRAQLYLDELGRFAPDILAAVKATLDESATNDGLIQLADSYSNCPADSIDYAVMEKTDKAVVVPLDAGWSDVGSWDAVYDLLPKDADGNSLSGNVFTEASRNCLVKATHRTVGIVGLEDIIVVETEDAVLVMPKSESQRLKDLVAKVRDSQQ
jgi:mannose-1-phosphate guanylyltransferase/mannose-6-phosphate isomerase